MSLSVVALQDRLDLRIVTDPSEPRSLVPLSDDIERNRNKALLLQVRGLGKIYGGLEAVSSVDLDLPVGQITGLIGPNGAGKTTLLNIISRVERASAGRVLFLGEDIGLLPQHRLAARGLVRTFQISRELGQLTVLENMLLARPGQTGEKLMKLNK